MYTNRTELMLYTRYGRLPPSRARPGPIAADERPGPRVSRGWSSAPRPGGAGRPLASLVRARAEARSRARRARARERYLELEFAVGFPPEDELGRSR